MEGVGSTRLGRSSARYGPTAVFNGPVRKWKKKWVHVSPPSTVSHHNSQSHSGNSGNSNSSSSSSSSILLCRWTPLPSSDSISGATEEPPKRKFRYTPVAVLDDERKREVTKRVENEAKMNEANQPSGWLSSKGDKVNINKDLKHEIQDSNMGHLDLGLGLKGQNDNGQNKDQAKTAGLGPFWKMDQQ